MDESRVPGEIILGYTHPQRSSCCGALFEGAYVLKEDGSHLGRKVGSL